MNPLILPAMGEIVPLLFFLENGFGIKLPTKVDVPLNKETKPNLISWIQVEHKENLIKKYDLKTN